MKMGGERVVKVGRDEIAACMTCPICDKLFRSATTIPECLHTFCRKCIRRKFIEEELECCPICNIDLGCAPLEKLRPDHNLEDVRAKIFPYKRARVNAPEVVPAALPSRQKERSLSSLVVSTPRVSTKATMTGKRSRLTSRKKSRGSGFFIKKGAKKEQEPMEDSEESSSSHETSNRVNHNSKQNSFTAEPSSHPPSEEEKEGGKPWERKVDWKPLDDLVEAANRSKSSKVNTQGSMAKADPPYSVRSVRKSKGKGQLQKYKVEDMDDTAESVKPKKLRRYRKRKSNGLGNLSVTAAQAMLDAGANNVIREKRNYPMWFQLVPFKDQEGEPLRQIKGRYVKLNDGNVPVSIIQKLVTTKLELPSENEVELRCMGKPVVPTLQLHNLIELWLQAHPDIITTKVGSSAHEYVMEISYAKKASTPSPSPILQTS